MCVAATADVLLSFGANIRAVDKQGRTPLHYVYGELESIHEQVQWLVDHLGSPKSYSQRSSAGLGVGMDLEVRVAKMYGEPPAPDQPLFDSYNPAEYAQEVAAAANDPHHRCWCLPKVELLRRDTRATLLARELRDTLETEARRLHLVAELAVRMGAELTVKDNRDRACFSEHAMQQWYDDQEPLLAKEAWTNVGTGYQSQMFQDPRTQLAVQRRWELDIQGKVYMRLVCWVLFIILVMIVAVWQTGRNLHVTRSFQASFEEAIIFDEYGDHHSGFWDMRNSGEMYQWLTEILGPNLYENEGVYREGAEAAKAQPHQAGSIMYFNHLIGRPRIRTIRSRAVHCQGLDRLLKSFNQSVCFDRVVASDEDTRAFKTGKCVACVHLCVCVLCVACVRVVCVLCVLCVCVCCACVWCW